MTDTSSGPAPVDPSISDPRLRPTKWWQWMVLFPTFGMALITALPDWVDSIHAYTQGVYDKKYSELLEMNQLYQNNLDCLGGPPIWYKAANAGRIVDATVCPSGDLFVRVGVPDDTSPLVTLVDGKRFRETSDFVSIEKIVEKAKRIAVLDIIGSAAFAGTVPRQSVPSTGPLTLAQAPGDYLICQTFVDQRMLLRHLTVEGQCFDEVIDTFTGTTVSRVNVPCRATC